MAEKKTVGHFTFRTESHKGKDPETQQDAEKVLEVLYVKGHGTGWKRAGAWTARPSKEQVDEILEQIGEAEKMDELVAVPGIPKVAVCGKDSFVVQIQTEEGAKVPPSLLCSYALELVQPKEKWTARAIGGGKVRLSFKS